MIKSAQIRLTSLSIVYFLLLTAIFLPHHHHEEIACFTTTHCEDDQDKHDQGANEAADHHHDNTTSEEPQNCLSLEYYLTTSTDAGVKKFFIPVSFESDHYFQSISFLHSVEEEMINENNLFVCLQSDKRQYTFLIKHELPLRAPPYISI